MAWKIWMQRLRFFADRHGRRRASNARRTLREQVEFQPALARLEDRRVLSVSVGVDVGAVTFQADSANDSLSLGVDSGGYLQYSCDGGNHWSTDLDSATSAIETLKVQDLAQVQFLGGDGDDTLTIDFSGGSPIPSGGIFFDGGDGQDALRIVGSGLEATYLPDAAVSGSGVIRLDSGLISFAGLAPIDYDVVGGSLTLNLPGGDNVVDIANSTLTDGVTPALQISGTSGGTAFENVRIRGSDIVIDTTTVVGVDTVTITSADNLHGNSSLRITTGGEDGDSVWVKGVTTFAGTVTIDAPAVHLDAKVTNAVQGSAQTVYVTAPGQIQDGIDVAASGGTVYVHTGTYAENVDAATPAKDVNLSPGAGLGQVAIDGNLTLNAGDTLSMELAGLNPETDYDNFIVRGQVVLDGATLAAGRASFFVPPNETSFILIDNDGRSDPVTGTFDGLDENATVVLSGIPFTISYQGGDGNDVVLTIVTPTAVYVDDSWLATPVGTTPVTSDPAGLIFQYNAFAVIQDGIDRVATDGTVTVYGGEYAEPVDIYKSLQPIRIGTNAHTPAETLVDIAGAVTLGVNTAFLQNGGTDLTFRSTIDGPWDLTLDAGEGNVTLGGDVGVTGELNELRILSARDVTAQASIRTAGSLIVDAAGDIQVNALVESGSGTVRFVAGGDVQISSAGRIVTAGAALDIAAGGQLLMSDGAMVDAAAGTIRVSADEGITVGRFVSETLVVLTSAEGAIRDGGDTGGADIVSPALALRAAGGIGVGDPLETQVQWMAAENTAGGGIQITNDGPLTIGSVDGLLGMTNHGGGTLTIANQGDLLVSHPVRNVGGGDTELTVLGGTLTIGATIANDVAGNLAGGGITLQAESDVVIQADIVTNGGMLSGTTAHRGIILVAAGGSIQLEPGVTIATGTGQMTAAPTPGDMPPPVDVQLIPIDQGGSNINSMGRGFIEVTVGDVGQNYQITIDWSNGVVTYPPGKSVDNQTWFVSGQTYRFDRYYTSNPDPTNASAPIPVHVTIAYDGRSQANQPLNGIVFREGGQILTTTVADVLTVPGTGVFAAIKVVKSEIVPVALRQAAATVPIVNQAVSGSQQTSTYEQAVAELEFASQTGLRVFFRRVDAAGQEDADVDLPPELIEGGLFEVFQRFPNGRYRIYLKEANSERERMIQELNVYQGRIVPPDFRDGASERQMEIENDPPNGERPRDESPADANRIEACGDRPESGQKPPVPAEKSQAESHGGDEQSAVPDAAAAAWGRAAVAAGAIGGAGLRDGTRQVDQAFAAGRRSLTAGARLMRRLGTRSREHKLETGDLRSEI